MMKTKRYLFILAFCTLGFASLAQDIPFQQHLYTGMHSNPASVSAGAKMMLSGTYRNTSYLENIEERSSFLMFSRPLYQKNKKFGGLGISLLSNKQDNEIPLRYEGISLAYAHQIKITRRSRLAMGLQMGYFQKKLDYAGFSTGSQWSNAEGYNPVLSNGESLGDLSTSHADISTGLLWYIPGEGGLHRALLGFSAAHLNRPDYSFFDAGYKTPIRWTATGSYTLYAGDQLSLSPRTFWMRSFTRNTIDLALDWEYRWNADRKSPANKSLALNGMLGYRWDEGIMAGIGFVLPDFSLALAYHYPNWTNNVVPNQGTLEISLCLQREVASPAANQSVQQLTEADPYATRDFNFHENRSDLKDLQKQMAAEQAKQAENYHMMKDFRFSFNSATLKPEAHKYLDELATMRKDEPGLHLLITGHTDNVGSPAGNMRISQERADVVKAYLMKQGIPGERIRSLGAADKDPLYENNNEEHRALNRRVEFTLYYPAHEE